MAEALKAEGSHESEEKPHDHPDISAAAAALTARLSKKRTKTGCLTCRKRRIKCGEERPKCRNCIKSKRQCEGYNHRDFFRAPTVDFRHLQNGSATITFQAGAMGLDLEHFAQGIHYTDANGTIHSQLRPRPIVPAPYMTGPGQPQYYSEHLGQPQPVVSQPYMHPQFHQHVYPGMSTAQYHAPHYAQPLQPAPIHHGPQMLHNYPGPDQTAHLYEPMQPFAQYSQPPPNYGRHDSAFPQDSTITQSTHSQSTWQTTTVRHPLSTSRMPENNHASHNYIDRPANVGAVHTRFEPYEPQRPPMGASLAHNATWQNPEYTRRPELYRPIDSRTVITPPEGIPTVNVQNFQPIYSTEILNDAAIETYDDDYYDVNSDNEMDDELTEEKEYQTFDTSSRQEHSQAGTIMALSKLEINELPPYGYQSFVKCNVLDHYRPEWVANPLKNATTASVFAHFIRATGPTISIFTKRPANRGQSPNSTLPLSQQGIWTHTMPMAALQHQGLLQAMLALSSLHIAKLTGASTTPSFKHYAYALKRVHHCVEPGNPQRRRSVAVLAATLLLGFYELWSADHMKWNSHLVGAKQLVNETDFASMNKSLRRLKAERTARLDQQKGARNRDGHPRPESAQTRRQDELLDQVPDIDPGVVSLCAGNSVDYEDFGHILNDENASRRSQASVLDIPKFEALKDLYWWYCKQDSYQSIVSGNPLLMTFARWTDCPPRAPINDFNAPYGSNDHLLLLLARIADFAARDRKRKIRLTEATGGQWRPVPGMQLGPASSGGQPSPGSRPPPGAHPHGAMPPSAAPSAGPPGGARPTPPAFYGMAPPPPKVAMPQSYRTGHDSASPESTQSSEPIDLSEATQNALEEWGQIRAALHTFQSMHGQNFQPLGPDVYQPLPTPFGNALFYRSFDVACLWAIFNMAIIIAQRSHPHMPPHAHMAAGVAAYQTRHYANEIARIAAGVIPPPPGEPLSPDTGAALCEICVPMFFAGVQFQESDQREWSVSRLFEIERRCGFVTAGVIASGCQTAWYKSYLAGRGPVYERRYNTSAQDDRMNGNWEKTGMSGQPNQEDQTDRRFVHTMPSARLHWAMGIIGMEDDK